jgi:dienelactone hydrolase
MLFLSESGKFAPKSSNMIIVRNNLICTAITFLVLGSQQLSAQKPPVGLEACGYNNWGRAGGASISNDGRYAMYTVYNQTPGSVTLTIQALAGGPAKEVKGIGSGAFTDDSRQALFTNSGDSLCMMTLSSFQEKWTAGISSYKLLGRGKKAAMLYLTSGKEKELVMKNLADGGEKHYPGVVEYMMDDQEQRVVLTKKDGLSLLDLSTGLERQCWKGSSAENLVINGRSGSVAFIAPSDGHRSVWCYKAGMDEASVLVDGVGEEKRTGLEVNSIERFSKDGSQLFFRYREKELPKADPAAVMVDIWSYSDKKLQSQQLAELKDESTRLHRYMASVAIASRQIVQLHQGEEQLSLFDNNDSIAIITLRQSADGERTWNKFASVSAWMMDTRSGVRRPLPLDYASISPNGKFLMGMVADDWLDLYSYELATGVLRNLTKALPIPALSDHYNVMEKTRGLSEAGYMKQGNDILLYDDYDIWQISLGQTHAPVNLTNGYGRKTGIAFRFNREPGTTEVDPGGRYLLSGYSEKTKDNGFFWFRPKQAANPALLTMGPYVYDLKMGPADETVRDFAVLKARDKNVWVLMRMTASESPNFFWTTDFKKLNVLSQVYPEKRYNWLTSELVHFKKVDGAEEQGVLYKPEDFDPAKKYPVIIHYYERLSDRIHSFVDPEATGHHINIPWFVSRGYVVFTPDIHYTVGHAGRSAYNSIVGAANYLAALPWVSKDRIGLQGQSFGGFETNYVITHSTLFAAAMSSAGPSDAISGVAHLWGDGTDSHGFYEISQVRMGVSLWQDPEPYLDNSPVLAADKVTTPVLMMNNKNDGAVDFSQGVEFFTALRRLGKRAWMLQYDGEGHVVINDKAAILHTLRITQFFDHYLKDKPAPRWMTRGIPAKMKGIDEGMTPDNEIKTPGPGLLMTEQTPK